MKPLRWTLFAALMQGLFLLVLLSSCTIPPFTHVAGGVTVTDGEATLFTKSDGQATQTDITVTSTAPTGVVTTTKIKRLHLVRKKDETVVPAAAIAGAVTTTGIKDLGKTTRAADSNLTTRDLARTQVKQTAQEGANAEGLAKTTGDAAVNLENAKK